MHNFSIDHVSGIAVMNTQFDSLMTDYTYTHSTGTVDLSAHTGTTGDASDLLLTISDVVDWIKLVRLELKPVNATQRNFIVRQEKSGNIFTLEVRAGAIIVSECSIDMSTRVATVDARPAIQLYWMEFVRWIKFWQEYADLAMAMS